MTAFESITQLQIKGSLSFNFGMVTASDRLSSDSTFGGLVEVMRFDSGSSHVWSTRGICGVDLEQVDEFVLIF